MKTFFDYFLEEVARKQEAGELEAEKAQRWVAEMQSHLHASSQAVPTAPLVQLPLRQSPRAPARLGAPANGSSLRTMQWRLGPR
jgi:hypothetical protein